MASRADLARLRRANADLTTVVQRDLKAFWDSLNLAKPEAARDALLEFVPVLVSEYGDMAAIVSADWYDDLRAGAGARGRFAAIAADVVPQDAVTASVRYGAGYLFTDNPTGTLAFLDGATPRLVLQAGRDTIVRSTQADPRASGWQRVTSGGCEFCIGLAARGVVYGEASANFEAHDHCRCEAVPAFS